MGAISARENAVPHFSAFRPVSSVASSSTSKFVSNSITSEMYAQRNQGKESPEQSAIEQSFSIANKVFMTTFNATNKSL